MLYLLLFTSMKATAYIKRHKSIVMRTLMLKEADDSLSSHS